MNFQKIIKIFFLCISIKIITWSLFIPLWQFPDEQAHFSHVASLAEKEQLSFPSGKNNLTEEIAVSEQLLGTYRDKYGNNKFTFHPEYRLDYTDYLTGQYEEIIKNQPLSTRTNLVDVESAYYPDFFYQISGIIYKLFYFKDIFVRVFSIRLFWFITHLLMICLSYKTSRLIFPKQLLMVLTITVLTGFQPMLTFVASGVTSDNLLNLLFTALIYFCLKLWQKLNCPDLIGLAIVMTLGIVTKPQFLISLAVVLPILFIKLYKTNGKTFKVILTFITFTTGAYFLFLLKQGKIPYFEISPNLARPDYTLWQHVIYTTQHTFREVLPWYWGVFRWLSLVLPRWVNRVMMRLLLVSGIGLIIKSFRRQFEPGLWIIIWSALVYFLALFFWDFQHIRNAGFPFGIQGRYYFPVIVPHMILLAIGFKETASLIFRKFTKYFLLALSYWFILLNWIAFYWVTASYYSTSNFSSYIIQASQYKPFFAKGWWLVFTLSLTILTILIFSYQLFKVFRHEK